MIGTAIIKEEATDEGGFVVGSPISYHGTMEIDFPKNKKGDAGECFASVPGTHLTTRNFTNQATLAHALQNGGVVVK